MLITSRMVRGRCPACGADHAACGPPSDSVPVDMNVEVAVVGGPLKRYKVTTPHGVETVMKLNESDAKRLGAEPLEQEPAEQAEEPAVKPAAKKRTAANKARTAQNKSEG